MQHAESAFGPWISNFPNLLPLEERSSQKPIKAIQQALFLFSK